MERRDRLSSRETRAALIESGCELFVEARTDWGLGRISLGEAISRADVSRASAYRVFGTSDKDPQDDFQLAVLLEVIQQTVVDTSIVGEVLSGLDSGAFGPEPVGRAAELREVIRCWTNLNLDNNRQNELVRAFDVCRAVVSLSPNPDPEILAALRHALERSKVEFEPYIQALAERYGVRPRPWTSLEQMQHVFIALTTMAMAEWEIDETTRTFMRPTGPKGEDQDWTLSGMLIESLCLIALEADPEAKVSADLTSWLD